MLVGTLSGILLGVVAAHFRNRGLDHGARLFALIGSSIPVFWSGLILLFIFSVTLGWLPGPGRLDPRTAAPPFVTGMFTVDSLLAGDLGTFMDAIHHLLLPAFVLGWAVMGIISRLVRASMLDVLGQDYILAARAKGAGERAHPLEPRAAQRADPDAYDRRLLLRLSDHRRGADRDRSSPGPASAPTPSIPRARSTIRRSSA